LPKVAEELEEVKVKVRVRDRIKVRVSDWIKVRGRD
jgi:hypothetical protein